MKLVPNSARITVTRSDSAYSTRPALVRGLASSRAAMRTASAISGSPRSGAGRKLLEGHASGGEFRLLFAQPLAHAERAALGIDLDAECLAMVRADRLAQPVLRLLPAQIAQAVIQRGLGVGLAELFHTLAHGFIPKRAPDKLPGGGESAIL